MSLPHMNYRIGERLKELRIAKDMNQDELSVALDVSRSTIGMYEQGQREPSLDMLLKYCEFFSVDMNYICSMQKQFSKEQSNYPVFPCFSDRLRYIMDERNMTSAEVSQQTGINKGTISKYLSGGYTPKYETVRKIASSMSVDAHWLLGKSINDGTDLHTANIPAQIAPETDDADTVDIKAIRLKLISAITAMPDEDILFLKRLLDTKI